MCFQAYSSLGKGELVTDPVVVEVAETYECKPAQVITLTKLFVFLEQFTY